MNCAAMKIESFESMHKLMPVTNEPASASLQKGDIIKATVIAQNEGTVTLKSEGGMVFFAKINSDCALSVRDEIEFAVTSHAQDKVILQVLSIESAPRKAVVIPSALLQLGLEKDQTAAKILQIFKSMDRMPTAGTIAKAVAMCDEHGIDARTAVFFAANGKEFSDNSAQAYTSLTNGDTTGKSLYEIADAAANLIFDADPAGLTEPAVQKSGMQTSVSEQKIIASHTNAGVFESTDKHEDMLKYLKNTNIQKTDSEASLQNNHSVKDLPSGAGPDTSNAVGKQSAPNTQSYGQANQTAAINNNEESALNAQHKLDTAAEMQQQTADAFDLESKTALPQNRGLFTNTSIKPTSSHEPAPDSVDSAYDTVKSAAADTGSEPARKMLTELSNRLISLFLELDDKLNGAEIKKNTEKVMHQIAELEQMAENHEIKEEAVNNSISKTVNQLNLTQDLNRMVCLHIPVHMNSYDSAELYVYKRANRDKSVDSENTSILIGLNTEYLGRVETLMRVEQRNISLTFWLEDEPMIAEFKASSNMLVKALSDMRFSVIETKVAKLKAHTTVANAEEVLASSMRKPSAGIDFRI